MRTSVCEHYRRKPRGGFCSVRRHYRLVSGRELKDYAGMNREAARTLGFKPSPRRGEVIVNRGLSSLEQRKTIVHENIEEGLMKRGVAYWPAHKAALKAEVVVKHPGRDVLPDEAFNQTQLRIGSRVEREHTESEREARRIAKAHLLERPDYYVRLKKVENA